MWPTYYDMAPIIKEALIYPKTYMYIFISVWLDFLVRSGTASLLLMVAEPLDHQVAPPYQRPSGATVSPARRSAKPVWIHAAVAKATMDKTIATIPVCIYSSLFKLSDPLVGLAWCLFVEFELSHLLYPTGHIKSKPAIIVCILTVYCCTLYSIYVCTGLLPYVLVLNGRVQKSPLWPSVTLNFYWIQLYRLECIC